MIFQTERTKHEFFGWNGWLAGSLAACLASWLAAKLDGGLAARGARKIIGKITRKMGLNIMAILGQNMAQY